MSLTKGKELVDTCGSFELMQIFNAFPPRQILNLLFESGLDGYREELEDKLDNRPSDDLKFDECGELMNPIIQRWDSFSLDQSDYDKLYAYHNKKWGKLPVMHVDVDTKHIVDWFRNLPGI